MPNFKSANWLPSIAELQQLNMIGSEDGVWIRTATATGGEGLNWFDVGTTINWFDVGTTINWFDFETETPGASSENWIGWTWRKNATNGLAAAGGGYWIPANNGAITFSGGGDGGGITEAQALIISEAAIEARLPLDWTLDVSGKPATFPPSNHSHDYSQLTGVASSVHNHTTEEITGLSAWLSGQIIDFSQIQNIVYPPNEVTSVNDQIGEVILSAADVGAAALSHSHLVEDILDFNVAFTENFNSEFNSILPDTEINFSQLIEIPFSLQSFLENLAFSNTGFLYQDGINTVVTVSGELLIDIVNLSGAGPGYLYFDGSDIILQSSDDEDLIGRIAVMVSAAWEQVKEEITFGKIPNKNFIHIH